MSVRRAPHPAQSRSQGVVQPHPEHGEAVLPQRQDVALCVAKAAGILAGREPSEENVVVDQFAGPTGRELPLALPLVRGAASPLQLESEIWNALYWPECGSSIKSSRRAPGEPGGSECQSNFRFRLTLWLRSVAYGKCLRHAPGDITLQCVHLDCWKLWNNNLSICSLSS
jgi:hypothetical protein